MAALAIGIGSLLIGGGAAISQRRRAKKGLKQQESELHKQQQKSNLEKAELESDIAKRKAVALNKKFGRSSLISADAGSRPTQLGGA